MNNFITNDRNITLKERLQSLIDASEELKFLVGFFYFSGWREIYDKIKENKDVTVKILVGLDVEKIISNTQKVVEMGISNPSLSNEEIFSNFIKSLGNAINNPDMDNEEFYKQFYFFVELVEKEKLIIRKTLEPNHAKLYLFRLKENNFGLDGEFITGSSNLTKAGLVSQNEFNVEVRDYGFSEAERYFDNLWRGAVPITENENNRRILVDFAKNRTQAAYVKPFEAYAYILKTYVELQTAKKISPFIDRLFEKSGFQKYKYQLDAVNQALNVIETYNGVIIADVVGLGKSVIASLVAKQLGKRGIVICPPGLIGDRRQNTGWWEYLNRFELYDWEIESTGKIEELAESMKANDGGYEVVIVDEAHRFRNQDTAAYEALANICKGKKVILLTATPFNNSPSDIFSLLKLFIVPGESGITIENNLEAKFSNYEYLFSRLAYILKNGKSGDLEKLKQSEKYYKEIFGKKPPIDFKLVKDMVGNIAKEIKSTISPVVIRRNRLDLANDYEYSKEIKNLSKIEDPKEVFFELTKRQLEFYDKIINEYFSEHGKFKGAIYKPFEYEKGTKNEDDENLSVLQQQRNLYDFMRRLLVKRFESSFGAFKNSVDRFVRVHKMVLEFIKASNKYVLDRKVIESIYNDDENADSFVAEEIQKALDKFKENAKDKKTPKHTKIYEIDKFKKSKQFLKDIENDLNLFEKVKNEIDELKLVENDPKMKTIMTKIIESLDKEPKRKIVLFSEYTDTIKYLEEKIDKNLKKIALFCMGNITKSLYTKINENFNAQYKTKKDDYRILITTDKLSEGVNLNSAGLIINYDIPWNPTRVIQRIGRINRIGKKVFDSLYIYNFFPTEKGADVVKSREIATQKMFLIHNALGEDSKVFDADEEPTASGLYKKLNTVEENDDEELNVLTLARNELNNIKEKYPDVIERIKHFPNRIKSAKKFESHNIVMIRKKGLAMFSILGTKGKKTETLQISLDKMLELTRCDYNEKRLNNSDNFWEIYSKMKEFKPLYKTKTSGASLEIKALSSLKSLLNNSSKIDENTLRFINTLIKDIRNYRTLSKYTLRRLILREDSENPYEELINSVQKIRRELGEEYLDLILQRASSVMDEIIITVENIGNYR